ncbi:MAG: DUF167 domain-containing protein [Moorellales bacterium]
MARLMVRVQPRASKDEICGWDRGILKVRVTAPPEKGAANEACRRLVADWLGVAPGRVALLRGHRQRDKLLEIAGIDEAYLEQRLASL